jgi:flagellar biosynthetic protein FliR
MMRLGGDLVTIAFVLAAPAALATFMTDVVMGLINRVAPQIQVFFISMTLKPVAAITLMLLALTVIVDRLDQLFGTTIHWTREVLRMLG